MNRSKWEFKLGERAGRRTAFTPAPSRMVRRRCQGWRTKFMVGPMPEGQIGEHRTQESRRQSAETAVGRWAATDSEIESCSSAEFLAHTRSRWKAETSTSPGTTVLWVPGLVSVSSARDACRSRTSSAPTGSWSAPSYSWRGRRTPGRRRYVGSWSPSSASPTRTRGPPSTPASPSRSRRDALAHG